MKKLFAIYKGGIHKGNERAFSSSEAIKNYIIASGLSNFLNDKNFISQYSVVEAVKGLHYS